LRAHNQAVCLAYSEAPTQYGELRTLSVESCYRDSVNRLASISVAVLLLAAPAAAQELQLGAAIYQQQCAVCHGELYRPDGPLDAESGPLPAYYAGHSYLMSVPPMYIRTAVLYGVTGTNMHGIGGAMSNGELNALIAYIESFRR